jgi:4-amino-4-deoxy-L-arabinose transferase-like glycosyltransferase
MELLIVAAFCGYLFFYGLGSFGLVGADEPRYAQVAREMLDRDDFITPTLHGEPWMEKPALYYWRAMFAFKEFGEQKDWPARLPSATFALGMITIIFFHMRRFRPGAQLDAALITASCAAVIGFARGASTDMQLAGPLTVAMLGWYAWFETGKKVWLIDLYFFLGVGTLAKGPVAPVLAGAIVLLFCGMRRDWKAALRTLWLPGVLLYLLVTLPWYVAVQWKNPTFLYVFILEHNLARFTTDVFRHAQPWWYYFPVLMLSLIPWTFFAIPALIDASRACVKDWRGAYIARTTGEERRRENPDAFPEFLVIWTLLPIIFFSISRSKLPGYILPAIAPCTILTADFLQRKREVALSRLITAAHAALSGIIVGLFMVFPYYFLQGVPVTGSARMLIALIAAGFFLGIYLTLQATGVRLLRFVTLLPVILIIGFIVRVASPKIDDYYSARPVEKSIEATVKQFANLEKDTGERPPYQNSPVAVYGVKRELRYGLEFYRNQAIKSYDENDIPAAEHLLVAHYGKLEDAEKLLGSRRIVKLGGFPAQKLDYYWVSRPSR